MDDLFTELVMELSRHEAVEEMLFWPVVRERRAAAPLTDVGTA